MPDLVNSGSITLVDGTSGVNPPAGSYLDIGVEDHPAVSIDLEGAFTATLVIEATEEQGPATDWFTPVVLSAAGVAASASLTAATRRFISAAGLARVRLRCTAFTSGPITATLRAGQGFVSAGGGGGGGGGAVTVGDGADIAQGTTTDAGIITNIAGTVIGFLRGGIIQWAAFLARFPAALVGGRLDVNVGATGVTQPVSGTVTANAGTGTLAVSAAALPLPAGAATETTLAAASAKLPAALVGARLDVNLGATGVTQPVSGTVTGNQGTANTAANAWPAKVTDGTNVAAVKAASTAAGATDPAAVVALSPNTALPAGSNALGSVTVTGTPAVSGTVTANQGTQGAGGTASWNVQGAGANQTAVAGNPNWIGAGTTAAGGNLQSLMVESATNPNLRVGIFQATNEAAVTSYGGDGYSTGTNALAALAAPALFNGTTLDRVRNNVDVILLASAARTTTQTSASLTTYNLGAIKFVLDVTAIVSTCSLTFSVSEIDPASGKAMVLLTGAVVAGVSTNEYVVDPVVPAVANVSAQKRVPRTIMYTVSVGNANSQTYSLGAMELPA